MLALHRCSITAALSLAVLAAAGCGPKPADDDGGADGTDTDGTGNTTGPTQTGNGETIAIVTNKDVDILFVIDNSASMGEEQATLAANAERFIGILERPDVAVNYRIGITTTDNGNPWCQGTGPEAGSLRLTSCRSRPTEFVFEGAVSIDVTQEACYDTCPEEWTNIEIQPTAAVFGGEEAPRNWLENIAGRTNLPQDLDPVQAFQCFAPQGINGCGFESHLESMWKALRRSDTQGDADYGFLRDGAVLQIVHLTDEVDCSYNNEHETIFLPDGDRVFWSDPAAPAPTSAVCWNAGVACTGSGTYDECHSVNLDSSGNEVSENSAPEDASLYPLSRYIDAVQEIENQKQMITPDQEVLVSIIGGVNSDGTITYQDSLQDQTFQDDFGIGPGCSSSNGQAVPPVRLAEFAREFQIGDDRNLYSVCDADYGPALEAIAESLADQIKPACMPACVADTVPNTPEVDPNCLLTQESPNPDGTFLQTSVLPCENGDVPPGEDVCFETLVGDQMDDLCIDIGFNLQFQIVRRPGVPAVGGTIITASCALSESKATDCPNLP